jgi:hypothetical protein
MLNMNHNGTLTYHLTVPSFTQYVQSNIIINTRYNNSQFPKEIFLSLLSTSMSRSGQLLLLEGRIFRNDGGAEICVKEVRLKIVTGKCLSIKCL